MVQQSGYSIYLKRSAEKDLDKLPDVVFERILRRLFSLRDNPRPPGVKKLRERNEYRISIGDYRVLYIINDAQKKIEIISAAHRKEVYR